MARPAPSGERPCASCRRPFPANGKKNCDACLAAAAESRVKPPPSLKLRPARRRCLGCGRDFDSSWIGHRVCEACKGTAAWAAGAALEPAPLVGLKRR